MEQDRESWLRAWYQAHQITSSNRPKRHETCCILEQNNVSSALWSEDALAYYGVKTVVFDIHILVPDVHAAEKVLVQRNYVPLPPKSGHRASSEEDVEIRLKIPGSGNELAAVVLLCADDWNFVLPKTLWASPPDSSPPSFVPRLQDLLDSLIDKWLENSDKVGMFRSYLSCYLGYLYHYVPVLKSPDFAQLLKSDHRQYHADYLSGMTMDSLYCRQHQKEIRDAI